MAHFTNETLQISKAYNLEPNQIVFAFAIASGCPTADAYNITHKMKATTTTEQAETLANALIASKPAIKIIINRIKNKQNPATFKKQEQQKLITQQQLKELEEQLTEEERDEFKTRSGLIEKIITQSTLVTGKDAISALQTLAKLQGFDKPDEMENEEKRRYFLPWVSHCRSCKLMEAYKKAMQEAKGQ